VRIRLAPHGASVRGETTPLVEGDAQFRPVAFATGREGAIYITDWVVREYPNHGRGRIWRLSARPGVEVRAPRRLEAPEAAAASDDELDGVRASHDVARLRTALMSPDPFTRSTAVQALTSPELREWVVQATADGNAEVRVGAVVALQRAGHAGGETVAARLLSDPDPRVRQMTLIWIGREGMTSLAAVLDRALAIAPVSPTLFETYVETVRFTQPAFVQAYRSQSARASKDIPRPLPPGLIETIVADHTRTAAVRAAAVLHLDDPSAHAPLLARLAGAGSEPVLRLEAIRSLAGVHTSHASETLQAIATSHDAPVAVRADAVLALAGHAGAAMTTLTSLLGDAAADVRVEAARALRLHAADPEVRDAARSVLARMDTADETPLREQLAMLLDEDAGATPRRPPNGVDWLRAVSSGGDEARGRRVFFAAPAACSACHVVDGRGGALGPDLTHVGESKTRQQLLHSVLEPSAEISPEWQGWFIRTTGGKTHYGRQIDVGVKAVDLYTLGAGFITVAKADIESYGMADASLMPAGLEAHLTVSDMRDLLAFLERSTTPDPSSGNQR
ncbi:MAG: c-type cytochrome, partial [Actinomycetota bacterium]|nr:c-type cytochrome [Actinomycetota bacterium]